MLYVCTMQTPQTPMVRPWKYDHYNIDDYPLGTNAIVAVISYTVSVSTIYVHVLSMGFYFGCICETACLFYVLVIV